jgi:hypothetical protein
LILYNGIQVYVPRSGLSEQKVRSSAALTADNFHPFGGRIAGLGYDGRMTPVDNISMLTEPNNSYINSLSFD